jgi:hypothetical protein
MGLAIAGAVLVFLGLLFSLTVIGAIIGIPMMIAGAIMMAVGVFGRRKTIITNVVQVSNAPGAQPAPANAVSLGVSAGPTAMSAVNCGACTTVNETTSKFCRNCGSVLAAAPA